MEPSPSRNAYQRGQGAQKPTIVGQIMGISARSEKQEIGEAGDGCQDEWGSEGVKFPT